MFACLHANASAPSGLQSLLTVADRFSPCVEINGPNTITFSVDGLNSLFGTPDQIAAEILRQSEGLGIRANVAIAANPDSAIYCASNVTGTTVVPNGMESETLKAIPLSQIPLSVEMREAVETWGIRTFGEFGALPPIAVVERLGEEGLHFQNLARGSLIRPLKPMREVIRLIRESDLDCELDNLEPLLFLINRMLVELCHEMSARGLAAANLRLQLKLDRSEDDERLISFPIPLRQPQTILKLTQLQLESNLPKSSITGICLEVKPVDPRVTQLGLYSAAQPEPARLHITLSRIAGLVGEHNVGVAELVDTHLPDAFVMKPFSLDSTSRQTQTCTCIKAESLALRVFRPPLKARVNLKEGAPERISATGVFGSVVECAGPWKSSGDWWSNCDWDFEEWDVLLSDGGVYRITEKKTGHAEWQVTGVYC